MTNFLPAADMKALEGVAIRDSESSFLISPLPQFTNILPSILDGLTPLPELSEDVEGEEKSDEDEEITTPDTHNHRPMDEHREIKMQPSSESISSQQLEFEASDPSRSSPYQRARSRSIPSHFSNTMLASPIRSASASPPYHFPSSPVQSNLYPHSVRDSYSSSTRTTEGDVLRTRLHDLLRDSSTPLPNAPPVQLPSSVSKREREDSTSSPSPPYRAGTTDSNKAQMTTQHSSGDGVAHLLASGSHQQHSNKPVPSPSPNPLGSQRYSSASTEAKKLEEERRRKHMEEKQQRQKERYKQKDDWYREERHKDERHSHDFERPPIDADREYYPKTSSSMTNTSTVSRRDLPAATNQPYVYGNSLTSNSVSSLNRRPSIGNSYNQQTAVPTATNHETSVHHSRYMAAPSGNKSRPMPVSSNPSNIYA